MTVPPCYDEDDDNYAGDDEHDGGVSCTLLLNVVEQLSRIALCHQLCTLYCAVRAAINCALGAVHSGLCTLHCELCTVHCALCHQTKTKCVEIQPGNQHCCSADARST